MSPKDRFAREELKKRCLPRLPLLCLTVVTVPTGVLNQIPSTSSSAFELGEVGRIDAEEGVGLQPISVVGNSSTRQ